MYLFFRFVQFCDGFESTVVYSVNRATATSSRSMECPSAADGDSWLTMAIMCGSVN